MSKLFKVQPQVLKPKAGKVYINMSYTYNGGTVIGGVWYDGYECPPPIVPDGYELTDYMGGGWGFDFNSKPPTAMQLLSKRNYLQN